MNSSRNIYLEYLLILDNHKTVEGILDEQWIGQYH